MDNMGAYELARTLVQGEDEQACERCLDQLEAYVEAQLAGEPTPASSPMSRATSTAAWPAPRPMGCSTRRSPRRRPLSRRISLSPT